jgi:hypothetical protein
MLANDIHRQTGLRGLIPLNLNVVWPLVAVLAISMAELEIIQEPNPSRAFPLGAAIKSLPSLLNYRIP